jgi:hypothetical protein
MMRKEEDDEPRQIQFPNRGLHGLPALRGKFMEKDSNKDLPAIFQ